MESFKDPTRLTRVTIIALCAYMALKALMTVLDLVTPGDAVLLPLSAIGYLVALVACFISVGMWIYRTNANAHSFSSDMTITPGWSVGWFFIPFANLVMPYRGVQETWRESHERAGRFEEVESSLLGWWWALWIANNVTSNFAGFFGGADNPTDGVKIVNVAAAGISVALCLVLIQLMRRLTSAQLDAAHGSVFA
jgi:hypothetical protein